MNGGIDILSYKLPWQEKKKHIRSSGRAIYHDLLIRYPFDVALTSGPMVEFRLLHTVVAGSNSSGGDHGVDCWCDLIRSK